MPVICLSQSEQISVIALYKHPTQTIRTVADEYRVALSTIHKILKEAGLTRTFVRKPSKEEFQMLNFLKEKSIDLGTLKDVVHLWYPETVTNTYSGIQQ
jgi:hypothetical protein